MKTDSNMLDRMEGTLVVRQRSLASLKPDPANARAHPKRQVAQIVASIRKFGFCNPIMIDEGGTIICGHGRYSASKSLGLSDVPTITLAGLSESEKRALRIADNKIAQNSSWSPELLREEFRKLSLPELEFDLHVTGFSAGEIEVVLGDKADPDDEVVPAVPEEARTKLGDIWRLGPHRLGCGDARDPAFLKRVIGADEQIDAAFLDPPYNVRIKGHANVRNRHDEFPMASGELSDGEFEAFLRESLQVAADLSRPGAVHFICMDWRHEPVLRAVGQAIYGELLNMCVWKKSNAGMGTFYRSQHELVLVFKVGDAPFFNAVELGKHGRNRTNVWDYKSVNSGRGARRDDLDLHPTVKPLDMVTDALKDVTKRGELILDSFAGSGTTLLAAQITGRRFRGVELSPAYVDVALARWTAMTGEDPQLEGEVL